MSKTHFLKNSKNIGEVFEGKSNDQEGNLSVILGHLFS
jgi:hypothetical protein